MALKITTWNIKDSDKLVTVAPTSDVEARRQRVRKTIEEINPDILCIQEGPQGEKAIDDFCTQVLNRQWLPALLQQNGEPIGAHDNDYETKGTQWIWFLVREGLAGKCKLQSPNVWHAFAGGKRWTVHPWGEEKPKHHSHYRHPQVLVFDLGAGQQIEFIGVHLKSKINLKSITRDKEDNLTGEYLKEALQARMKLATEARNVRHYIAAKFNQAAQPALIVVGDCNDGPGHDFFETEYLFFDLISNIQGDVVIAERFFNHVLFDFPSDLRWTAKFPDEVSKIPASKNPLLLDHILISQSLVRRGLVNAGIVEHEAYERHNAGSNNSSRSSDHRPVSCKLGKVA